MNIKKTLLPVIAVAAFLPMTDLAYGKDFKCPQPADLEWKRGSGIYEGVWRATPNEANSDGFDGMLEVYSTDINPPVHLVTQPGTYAVDVWNNSWTLGCYYEILHRGRSQFTAHNVHSNHCMSYPHHITCN